MKYVLSLLIVILMIGDIFDLGMSLGPGLSLKNAGVYLLLLTMVVEFALKRNFKPEMTAVTLCLVGLIGMAILSWSVTAFFLNYPGYDRLYTALRIKAYYGDFLVFFLVYLYGIRSRDDLNFVLSVMLGACFVSNLLTVVDSIGILDIAAITIDPDDGRFNGVVGAKNSHAAYLLIFVPPMWAYALKSQGLSKAFWLAAALLSFGMLLAGVSRGAYVGLIAAIVGSIILFRKYITAAHVARAIAIGLPALMGLFAIVFLIAGGLIQERLLNQPVDADEMSSGRFDVWSDYIGRMIAQPISFITGMGWEAYTTIPYFKNGRPPHNEYIYVWFHLGLVGIVCQLLLFYFLIKALINASDRSVGDRQFFVAGTMSVIGMAVALFFTPLYEPWPYFWAYMGLMMRLCVIVREEGKGRQFAQIVQPASVSAIQKKDRFGWSGQRADEP